MTPEQITVVKQTWRDAIGRSPPLAELFYQKLFALDPTLRALFLNDPVTRQKKFTDTLSAIIDALDQPAAMVSRVYALGVSHAGYGVKDEHYATVEQALLGALQESLGDGFNAAAEQAWRRAYRALADGMTSADIDAHQYPR